MDHPPQQRDSRGRRQLRRLELRSLPGWHGHLVQLASARKWGYDQNGCFKLDFGNTVLPDDTPFFFGIAIYDKTYKGSASTQLNKVTKEVEGKTTTYYYGSITWKQINDAIKSKGFFKTDLSNNAGYIMLTPEPTSGLLLLLGTGLLALRRKAVRV